MNGGDDDGYTRMDVELPQTTSPSSMQPFLLHGATPEFAEVFPALTRRLARLARPMLLHHRRGPVSRDRALTLVSVWTQRDGYLYGGDDGDGDIGVDVDDGGGGAYGGGGFGAVPASGVAIAGLPERTVGESEAAGKAECAVCLEGYEVGETLRTMPCSHGFHESCIFGWLRVSRLCPLCRFAMPAENETEEEDGEEDG